MTSMTGPVWGVTMLEDFEVSRVAAFFKRITTQFPLTDDTSAVVITHLLPERPVFLRAVARAANVAVVLPKPKSIDAGALRETPATSR